MASSVLGGNNELFVQNHRKHPVQWHNLGEGRGRDRRGSPDKKIRGMANKVCVTADAVQSMHTVWRGNPLIGNGDSATAICSPIRRSRSSHCAPRLRDISVLGRDTCILGRQNGHASYPLYLVWVNHYSWLLSYTKHQGYKYPHFPFPICSKTHVKTRTIHEAFFSLSFK